MNSLKFKMKPWYRTIWDGSKLHFSTEKENPANKKIFFTNVEWIFSAATMYGNTEMYGNVKKMYGNVRMESWCTVRTKICTDVRNSRKKLNFFI